MRELIFRYRFLNRKTNEIIEQVMTISQIEHCPFQPNPFEGFDWEILSRDVWTEQLDKSGTRIFEGDVYDWRGKEQGVIKFYDGSFWCSPGVLSLKPDCELSAMRDCEVVGHIYQPEWAHLREE